MTQPSVVTHIDQVTFSGVPFREFIGKLENMDFPTEQGQPKTILMFTELKMLRTLQNYPHPACSITMNRANQKGEVSDRGPWGKFIIASSDQGYPDCIDLIGKTLHMNATEQVIEANPSRNQTGGTFITWDILSVDGKDARPTAEDQADTQAPLADAE